MHFFAFCQEETFFDNTHNGSKLHPVACEVLFLTAWKHVPFHGFSVGYLMWRDQGTTHHLQIKGSSGWQSQV